MASSGARQQHYARQATGDGSRNFVSRWPPTGTNLVAPALGYPEAGVGSMGDGTSVPEAISNNDLRQHRFAAAPPDQQATSLGTGGPRHQQQPHERKPWLKPVSSLIRGIPQSKQQQQQQQQQQQGGWSGRNFGSAAGPPPAIHMVPQQDTHQLSPGWRGPAAAAAAATASSVVESGTNAAMQVREERQQQQRQGELSFGRERSRSVSPRIVRGPFGTRLSSPATHHPNSSPAGEPEQRQLYDLPRSHHRSRSDQIYAAGCDGRASSGGGGGFESSPSSFFDRNYEQEQQQYFFCTGAADAAVSAVPVPRDEPTPSSDPYRTPTAAGAPPPFWGEPGESPAKQQRNGTRPAKDPPRQQPKPQCLFRGCPRRPTHAVRGERPTSCAEHHTPGMSDTTAAGGSKRNRCLMPGCSKPPRYALPGQKAEYCTLHKNSALHVDVKHPRCESELGCVRQPTFGWEGEKARFCSAHKVDGMLDVKNPRCGEPGCLKRPRYGEEGGRARFCAAHRFDDMVDLASRRSTGSGSSSSGAKHCVSPAKRPRNGPRSIAHDSSAAAAAVEAAAAALPSSPAFSLRAAGGGGGRGGGGAPLATRGHTPAHAGGHRRATSESWIDFCPKRVFETTGPKNEDGVVDLPVPRHTNTTASRRARHHAPRTVNTSMAAMAATATSPSNSLSMMAGNGGNLSFDEGAELESSSGDRTRRRGGRGVATTPFFQAGGSGSGGSGSGGSGRGGWGYSSAACAGWLSSDRGDTITASKAGSVSIAALGGELAALAAAPISDASPLPSPGSASSPRATGAASTSASASAPGTSSGFCFSSSPFPGGGGVSSAVKQEEQTMAPAATVTAPVTPQSSSDNINGGGGGAGGKGGGGRGHRFNASDYEASAILLECRSGMLSGEQRI